MRDFTLPNDNLLSEDFSNILGIKLNLFQNASSGGKKWNINEAVRFSGQTAGKVESARNDLNSIIGQDASAVKAKRTADFARMLADAKLKLPLLEQKYKEFLLAKKKGWSTQAARDEGKLAYDRILSIENAAHAAWKLKHDWITESLIDKAAQGFKVINLAVFREVFLLFLQFNFINLATKLKLTQLRKPAEYVKMQAYFKTAGGKRTTFDKFVDKGYKKKPLLATQMKIDWNKKVIPPKLNADGAPETDTVKTPDSVMASIPALATTAGGTICAETTIGAAGCAAVGAAVGAAVDVLLGMVNKADVPLDADETQGEVNPNAKVTAADIQALKDAKKEAQDEANKTGFPTWGYFAIGGGVLLVGGLLTWYLIKRKK